jgi:Protein of unknown function (DUF3306)
MTRLLRARIGAIQGQGRLVAELQPVPPTEGISLSRWSRLKRAAANGQATPPAVRAEPVEALLASKQGNDRLSPNGDVQAVSTSDEYAELPPISAISLAEDFTPFMQAKVPQALKQQALKALFKAPHFNVMDGLDIYIDDYTVFEPISPEVMATLSSWKTIMNPPQHVVTSGGYAVDVQSEEGKAVLAEQARIAAINASESTLLPPEIEALEETQNAKIAAPLDQPETVAISAAPHPRYGKRVGDFVATDHVIDDSAVAADLPEKSNQ